MKLIFWTYTLCMVLTSLIPMDNSPDAAMAFSKLKPSYQNLLHIPMFMGFVYLLSRVMEDSCRGLSNKPLVVLLAAFFMNIFLETLQFFVPGRYPGAGDIMLNLLGTVIGLLLISVWKPRAHI